ncbi:MAG: DUF3622 domain-containing protein [Gammaproteobacteria bacterium]|jgi:Protein of unknown function (DUF3622)|nr:DUF3622 domain-containing protein [Gammaproteobacteria bacterium]
MMQSKKYDYQVAQSKDGWVTQITRKITSKKIHVTKSQDGFASESEARAWGENEVKVLLQNFAISEQKKRRAKKEAGKS